MISNEMMQEVLGTEMSAEALEMAQILYAAIPTNWALEDFAAAWKAGEKSRNRRENGDDKAARQEERERARQNRTAALVAKYAEKARKAEEKEAERQRKEAEKMAAKIQKLADRLATRMEKDDLIVWDVTGAVVDVTAYSHPELVSMALTIRSAGFITVLPYNGQNYQVCWSRKAKGEGVTAGVDIPEYYAM